MLLPGQAVSYVLDSVAHVPSTQSSEAGSVPEPGLQGRKWDSACQVVRMKRAGFRLHCVASQGLLVPADVIIHTRGEKEKK